MQKKYKIAVLILILGIVIIIGQKYTQATKQEDVVFAYYNSDTNGWLDDMPEKDNADNLVFEKAVCDDDVTVEWNEDKWAPLVLNLEASQARCTLYFSKPPIHLDKDIPLAKEGQDGLFTVEHNDLSEIKSDWNKTEYRYAGVNPDNYVKFNNELWRIIGLVNVKTSSGIEQRLKIIRTDDIEGQKDFGEYTWGYSFSEWKESELKDMLNGIYYNSKSGDCFPASNDGDKSTCDFSGNDATYPKGLDDTARNMVDSEVIWNTKNYTDYNIITKSMYEKERIERDTYDEDVWSPTNDTTYHKGIGIMYPSDYGYAVGGTVRNTCLSDTLYHYNKNSCYANDWLKASSGSQWLMLRNSNGGLVFYIYSLGFVNYVSGYNCYKVWPTAYLKSSVKITSGSGTTGSPFTLSL